MNPSEDVLSDSIERGLRRAYGRKPGNPPSFVESSGQSSWPDEPVDLPGTIGRFIVREELSRGGMGIVLRGEDPELGRAIAVKVSRTRNPALLRRFEAEARICSQLQHPGIVPIHELGRTDAGRPYYAMRLIEGDTLAQILAVEDATERDPSHLIDVFRVVCQTMAYVHARGAFHGDLKPANIMVGAFGEIQILDWGFAGRVRSEAPSVGIEASQDTPVAAGTPAYMPPEQARGEARSIGPLSDVFSLGSILCEILTGAPAYVGSCRDEIFLAASQGWLTDAYSRLDSVSSAEALVELARACLSASPADRPADAGVLARRLAAHAEAERHRARDAEIRLARAHARHAADRRARRLTVGLATAIVLGVLAAGTGLVLYQTERLDHQAESTRLVDAAILEAHRLRTDAAAATPVSIEAWQVAEAAAQAALALARDTSADADTVDRAVAVVDQTRALSAERTRYVVLLERLDEIEHRQLEEDRSWQWADDAYADAFRAHGLDPDALPDELSEVDPARSRLAVALARWSLVRRSATPGGGWKDLLAIAARADPDEERRTLAGIFLTEDGSGLPEGGHSALVHAAQSQASRSSPETMLLAARYLQALSQRHDAIEVLRLAHHNHPDDFTINHDLAILLQSEKPPPWNEITSLLSVCVGVRRTSAHAWTDFGSALYFSGDISRSLLALRRATEMQPGYGRAWTSLAAALLAAGEPDVANEVGQEAVRAGDARVLVDLATRVARELPDLAETAARRALELTPDAGATLALLGRLARRFGETEDAIEYLRRAVRLGGGAMAWVDLGRALADMVRFDEAVSACEQALALDGGCAEAMCELGRLLLIVERPHEGVDALRKGNALGTSSRNWTLPSARWLADARRAAELTSTVDVERRARARKNPDAVAEIARLASLRGWFAAGARLFEEALAEDPHLQVRWCHAAASTAARAGLGIGDAAGADDATRLRWRTAALDWLTGELSRMQRVWEASHVQAARIRGRLRTWKNDASLISPRTGPAFARLPASEREAWTAFWQGVDQLLEEQVRIGLEPGLTLEASFTLTAVGLSGPLGAVEFDPSGDTLYLIASGGLPKTAVHAVQVTRDPMTGRITGLGLPRHYVDAEHAAAGLVRGPEGTLFWTTWPTHELGQLTRAGDKHRFPLVGTGIPGSGGGLTFPPGPAHDDGVLMSSYANGNLYHVRLLSNPDGSFTPLPASVELLATLPGGTGALRYVPSGRWAGSLIFANWNAGTVSLAAVDSTGLPRQDQDGAAVTSNLLRGIEGAYGLAFDPVTGDLLVSTWAFGNRLLLISGVAGR